MMNKASEPTVDTWRSCTSHNWLWAYVAAAWESAFGCIEKDMQLVAITKIAAE